MTEGGDNGTPHENVRNQRREDVPTTGKEGAKHNRETVGDSEG